MPTNVIMATFTTPVNIRLVCLRCKLDLEYEGELEPSWFLDPTEYSCNCKTNDYWYIQLRFGEEYIK